MKQTAGIYQIRRPPGGARQALVLTTISEGGAGDLEAYLVNPREKAMGCDRNGERRSAARAIKSEPRGSLWSLPGGRRLPNLVDSVPLVLGDPAHPARLLPADLDDPQGFHSRLAAWLLRQGT